MAERGDLYEQEADLVVVSGDRIVSKVVDEIVEAMDR